MSQVSENTPNRFWQLTEKGLNPCANKLKPADINNKHMNTKYASLSSSL